jgi:citrate lyase gamma subunit
MVGVLFIGGCSTEDTTTTSASSTTPAAAQGEVVFAIADAAADMQAVTEAEITVDSIEVHAQGGAWTTVSSQSTVYDLLELRADGSTRLLAQAELASGSYDMVRLNVSQIIVTDNNGSHQCVIPNSTFEMEGEFNVQSNTTATVKSDFLVDESLHVASEGEYVFAPVVQLETRNDCTAEVKSDNLVEISGGQLVTDVKLGMNVNGEMGVGLGIDLGAVLDIGSSGVITIISGNESLTVTGTLESVDVIAETITIKTSSGNSLVLDISSTTTIKAGETLTGIVELAGRLGSAIQVEYNASTKTATNVTLQ